MSSSKLLTGQQGKTIKKIISYIIKVPSNFQSKTVNNLLKKQKAIRKLHSI